MLQPKYRVLLLALCAAVLLWFWQPISTRCAGDADEVARCLHTLTAFGWVVSAEPVSVETVTLSFAPDDPYLDLQTQAGFDLTTSLGHTATRYTFVIQNYPTGESGIFADVLVQNGQVVGGDVRCSALNGFLHSLIYP